MPWVVLTSSKSEVDRAGAALASNSETPADLELIDNWRSAHNFPLNTFQATLRAKAQRQEPGCIVSQRIKRLSSITEKLRRFKSTRLSQMQDIGGCRAVMSEVGMVKKLADVYRRGEIQMSLVSEKNYIERPKPDGYRGVHFVCKYSGRKKEYVDLKIEVQLRSANQHAWATAVETVGLFTHQALKSNKGHWQWLRFFACMGNAIAYKEGGNSVPNTPTYDDDLKDTLLDHISDLDVSSQLRSFGNALQELPKYQIKSDHYFILLIDPYSKELQVWGYKKSDLQTASRDYSDIEKSIKGGEKNAVLVSVDKTSDLRKAYPNYFLDTTRFLDLVDWAVSK